MSALDGIRQRAEAATEGPWNAQHRDPLAPENDPDILAKIRTARGGEQGSSIHRGEPVNPTWGSCWPHLNATADAEFIAHARTDIPRLLAALEAVLALADYWETLALGDQFYASRIRAAVNDALEGK